MGAFIYLMPFGSLYAEGMPRLDAAEHSELGRRFARAAAWWDFSQYIGFGSSWDHT